MLSTVRSIERAVMPLALEAYNKAQSTEAILPLIARVTPPQPQFVAQGEFTMEWVGVYPRLRQWVGDRKTQKAFSGSITFHRKKYEITYDIDELSLESGEALITIQSTTPAIMQEFVDGRWDLAWDVIRNNRVAPIDGQDLFDTAHSHPDGTNYSNLLTPTRAVDANPTLAEIRTEFRTARQTLLENRLLRTRAYDVSKAQASMVAVARSLPVLRVLEDLRNEEEIAGDKNIYKGSFEIIYDPAPAAGTENSWDLIWSEPNGPRPVTFVPIKVPNGIEIDAGQKFRNGKVDYGAYSVYAVEPAFPQTAVRSAP